MNYLEIIKEKLAQQMANVEVINDIKSMRFAVNPSVFVMLIKESSTSFLNLANSSQQVMVKFAVILAMKDFEAEPQAIHELKNKILQTLVGFCVDGSGYSPICFYAINNSEDKNLFCSQIEFGFSFVRKDV